LEDVNIVFDLHRPKKETLMFRLQKRAKSRLEKIAKSKGISLSSLARMWIMEKLHSSRI
jgi:predicted HicB family RNase H-like nuclease